MLILISLKLSHLKLIGGGRKNYYDCEMSSKIPKFFNNIISFLGNESLWEVKFNDKVSNIDSSCILQFD